MKILDTVALVACTSPTHQFHDDGEKYVRAITATDEVFVPSAALLELDLVMKAQNFSYEDRQKIFNLLSALVPLNKILLLTVQIMKRVSELDQIAKWRSHYFDVMMVAFAQEFGAEVVTTDSKLKNLGVKVTW